MIRLRKYCILFSLPFLLYYILLSSLSKASAGQLVAYPGVLQVKEETKSYSQGLLIRREIQNIVIKPLGNKVDDITITVCGKNICSGQYENGYLMYGKKKLYSSDSKNYRTSEWFPVLAAQGKSLVLSGTAHNRSTWQFKTSKGSILTMQGTPQDYKNVSDVLQDKTVSKIDIPDNAVFARVYYANLSDSTSELSEDLQIEYGKVPTSYQSYRSSGYKLAGLKSGDYLLYENNTWSIVNDKASKVIALEYHDLNVGDTLTLSSMGQCSLTVTWKKDNKEKISTGCYGVRWNRMDSNPVCERIGDAKGLHFNCVNGTSRLTPYQNDFDSIYPWSDIKVCAVKLDKNGQRQITYSDSKDFTTDGSIGNIMVEIPKFYCKREIIGDYEYLWISPTMKEGFSLDPSFVTSEGPVNTIYIGAYLSELDKDKLVSVSNSFPLIRKSWGKLKDLLDNSNGFTECDLLSILTVQRLYLVETAVLDSQSIFTGNVNLPYLLKDKATSYYAIKSEKSANRIYVKATAMTRKFRAGDAVTILDKWSDFTNEPGNFQREILKIRALKNETLEIEFSGTPVNITKQSTGITCIPCKNGETDSLPCLTGSIGGTSGHASFKYRGIENLWGNVSILLDGAYVKNSRLYIHYPTGDTRQIGYKLPVQNIQLSPKQFGDPSHMIVKTMGFDEENPLVMLPSNIGKGAMTSGYYCDAWYYLAEKDVTYLLTYGGAWDNKGYAGIFNFRATFTDKDALPFNGSRIMLR